MYSSQLEATRLNYVRIFRRKSKPVEDPTPTCEHLATVTELPEPGAHECAQCVAQGDTWVHLRMCLACGNVGCCDSSQNKHARAHSAGTEHPVIRGIEPGERWIYCFEDSETSSIPG
jgi:uncharacterized UBP type Zn finger protein